MSMRTPSPIYEAGIKSQFLDARAIVNLSVFYIDWSDIQQSVQLGGISATANSGDASSKGVELESVYSPFSSLRIGVNATYTDATLEAAPKQPQQQRSELHPCRECRNGALR